MRNRWYHTPLLHLGNLGIEKKATWLELFYDLIFVAAFIQLGNGLAAKISLYNFFVFILLFTTLWLVWTGLVFFINRFTVDDFLHRILVILQMFCIGVMAISAPHIFSGDSFYFEVSYGLAQMLIAVLYARTLNENNPARENSFFWGSVFGAAGLCWFSAAFIPSPLKFILWGFGIVLIFGASFSKASRAITMRYPIDLEHLSERYGLLTLIVLGESFVKVLSAFNEREISGQLVIQMILVLTITCSVWWVYFDDVAGSEIKNKPRSMVMWLYSHLPLQAGIIALGVSIKKAVFFDMGSAAIGKYSALLTGSLALTVISVGVIDYVTSRRQAELSDSSRVGMRLFSGLLFIIVGAVSGTMTAGLLIAIVTALCVAQVVFDMMMAPLEYGRLESEYQEKLSQVDLSSRVVKRTDRVPAKPRIRVGEAIRKGTPNEMRKDIYFFFMEGSWTKMFVSLLFLYFISNVFFAMLYLMEPGSIANAETDSFLDAFFFSVQTMSTIGYGKLAPSGEYSNLLVTIEAAFGLLSVALVTGLIFAKASRPKSQILYSNGMILTVMDKKPVLAFRAGNTRGNEIVDAELSLMALVDTVSPEGHRLRMIKDLKLRRKRTQFFRLSWTVMHVIDKDSPLYGINWENPEQTELIAITALIIGHDGTYAQTVYAPHIYYPDQIAIGHRYMDIIETLPDGRLMIDYEKFHNTVYDEKHDPVKHGLLLAKRPNKAKVARKGKKNASKTVKKGKSIKHTKVAKKTSKRLAKKAAATRKK